ncbi:MAG: hypothetical protein E7208_03715 [Clostridium butyricum]|nr:hypothetical protein [Clostridium butyricum]
MNKNYLEIEINNNIYYVVYEKKIFKKLEIKIFQKKFKSSFGGYWMKKIDYKVLETGSLSKRIKFLFLNFIECLKKRLLKLV